MTWRVNDSVETPCSITHSIKLPVPDNNGNTVREHVVLYCASPYPLMAAYVHCGLLSFHTICPLNVRSLVYNSQFCFIHWYRTKRTKKKKKKISASRWNSPLYYFPFFLFSFSFLFFFFWCPIPVILQAKNCITVKLFLFIFSLGFF